MRPSEETTEKERAIGISSSNPLSTDSTSHRHFTAGIGISHRRDPERKAAADLQAIPLRPVLPRAPAIPFAAPSYTAMHPPKDRNAPRSLPAASSIRPCASGAARQKSKRAQSERPLQSPAQRFPS